jgi:gamma-glutamyltranspeptidase/glutathione hydrolase
MKKIVTALTLFGLLAGCGNTPALNSSDPLQPEAATGYEAKSGATAKKFVVAAANPIATDAGYRILKAGGSATDAAIAIQMVLSLVEPQSSGLGGGAFLLHFNGTKVEAFDGRETAPAGVDGNIFLDKNGKPIPFYEAVVGGRSVGTPGTLRMLEMAHQRYGKLPWASLFEPAIALAEDGFKVSARLNSLLNKDRFLKNDPVALSYFYKKDGQAHEIDSVLRNPAMADLFRKIAINGVRAFYEGDVAQAIVKKVQKHPSNPGKLSIQDLESYKAKLRIAVCQDYRANTRDYQICGFPPPSSGGIAVGQILGILSNTNAFELALENGLPSAQWLHLYTEASRLAFADRAQYIADPDFVSPAAGNWMSLLDPAYLKKRAQLIEQTPGSNRMQSAPPGTPSNINPNYASMPEQVEHGTSHISIVDAFGNAVAMTSTIEDGFGSRQMVNATPGLSGGFLLNNELTDFSFTPSDASGVLVANRVQPGKRPRSSMAPTLVFDKSTGALVMVSGSPGGALIIHYSSKTLYGVLNWGLQAQKAIDLPNFGALNESLLLELKKFPPATVRSLKARGHDVVELDMTSGIQTLTQSELNGEKLFIGGADPRREGVVMGE